MQLLSFALRLASFAGNVGVLYFYLLYAQINTIFKYLERKIRRKEGMPIPCSIPKNIEKYRRRIRRKTDKEKADLSDILMYYLTIPLFSHRKE